MNRVLLVLVAAAALSACQCGGGNMKACNSNIDCNIGQTCQMGVCTGSTGVGGGSGVGGGGAGNGGGSAVGGGSGTGGGMVIYTGCDPTAADNANRDTDCDGLTDAEEYTTGWANGNKTDPCNADTDGDGIRDGVEAGKTTTINTTCGANFVPDSDPLTRTDPTQTDSDGDMLPDGQEDKNGDGQLGAGESRADRKDTDCDGLDDFQEVMGTLGCATDPQNIDTDGDGLPDGMEEGLQMPGADPMVCHYTAGLFDTDPTTKTDACKADSDGDGVADGAEDVNHNGKVDPGELDPTNPGDATAVVTAACATNNLKPITLQSSGFADVQVALVPTFTEVGHLNDGMQDRGFIFYDSTTGVAGLALSKTPTGGDASSDEIGDRSKLGSVSAPSSRTFTTWDNFALSVLSTYDLGGAADTKTAINNVAKNFLGANTAGLLSAGGTAGPFKVQAEFVHRTATREVVVVAIVPASMYSGQSLFALDDVAGGSALAQFGDTTAPTCEVFLSGNTATVDFVWDVDDSGSMASSQAAVLAAGNAFATKLATAGIDWRVAAVTTGYADSPGASEYRVFTNNSATMLGWFDQNNGTWFGTSGSGIEQPFPGFEQVTNSIWLPRTTNPADNKFRDGAAVHVIILTDTYDQSGIGGPAFAQFCTNLAGGPAVVHGIVCPEGGSCGDDPVAANPNGPIQQAIRATGGVNGDIQVAKAAGGGDATAQAQLNNYIDQILSVAIAGTGHQLTRPPISATIKVAIETGGTKGTCNTADIPRDRANGFDFDSASRRIVFYGNCLPNASGKQIAVSYKFWQDNSPDPGGDPCGGTCNSPKVCDPNQKTCVCEANCGGVCGSGTVCDLVQCACVPGIN
ncbi:MAG: hypothetical protein QM723_11970 [Myxococcaceae bacterium]